LGPGSGCGSPRSQPVGWRRPNLERARNTSASHLHGQSERRQGDAHANQNRCGSAPSWFRVQTTSRSWRIDCRSSASSEEQALAPAVRRPGFANLEATAVVTRLCNRPILHAGTSALHPAKTSNARLSHRPASSSSPPAAIGAAWTLTRATGATRAGDDKGEELQGGTRSVKPHERAGPASGRSTGSRSRPARQHVDGGELARRPRQLGKRQPGRAGQRHRAGGHRGAGARPSD
jgi:hypothetical protein